MAVLAGGSPHDVVKLAQPFKIIAFDWDGTAVMGRKEDATEVNALLDALMAAGVHIVVITGTNLGNVSAQLAKAIGGEHRGNLYIATNRGSEIFGFKDGPTPIPLWRRTASPEEEQQLTDAADAVRDFLRARSGLEVDIVYDRLNRRKIDLIPLPEWADPPKSEIGRLLEAVQQRLGQAGLTGGLVEVLRLARDTASQKGIEDPRVTSDVKHVEIGLTDKSDSIEWMARELTRAHGIRNEQVLIAGDEFGAIGGAEGSDFKMVTPHSAGAVFVSVGPEPGGVEPGIIHLGGGPARFRALLASQLELHRQRREAEPAYRLPVRRTTDQRWLLVEEGLELDREHAIESVFSVGNGYLGTRGSLAEGTLASSAPATFLAGVYDALPQPPGVPEYCVAPNWTKLRILVGGRELRLDVGTCIENRRILDLRQGIAWREWRHKDPEGRVTLLRGCRLASLSDRHLVMQSLLVIPENYSGRVRLEAIVERPHSLIAGVPVPRPHLLPCDDAETRRTTDPAVLLLRTPSSGVTVAMASRCQLRGPDGEIGARSTQRFAGVLVDGWEFDAVIGETYRLDRVVAFGTSREAGGGRPVGPARERVSVLQDGWADALATQHAESWRERWEQSDVEVEGDEESQRALRFAAYHLISAANPEDERVSIGARTLTGDSYKGHVFWDTDIFILPFFSFTHPDSARALLMYRFHTLPAAREKARALGFRGALFAWESADSGEETTPRFMMSPDGEVIRILSGDQEHHISADVAYAVWQHWRATGDDLFFRSAGAEIVLETARFWASRGQLGRDGHFHIREVVGPDEYHESVDDNAFTNVLAQWNLERALETADWMERHHPDHWEELRRRLDVTPEELEEWRVVAKAMYVGLDPGTGLIEQFRGFDRLEEYDLGPLRAQGKRAAALDLLLGRETTLRSKIVKQADVVMLLHLLWDRFPAKVREVNFRYYEPRTCHGSSLSPAVHASVAARLGDMETAEAYFRQAGQIDLANNMGNAAGGVHAAALGGLWQAAVFGFAGMQVRGDDRLHFDPKLPPKWRTLRFPLQFRGSRLRISVGGEPPAFRVRSEGPAPRLVLGADGEEREVGPDRLYLATQAEAGWSSWQEAAS